jgi:DNA-binding NtrC family response regulator
MRKTRILGIAPYDGIQALMRNEAAKRGDMELTAFVGDLEAGAQIAEKYTAGDFDAIVSRGGTAELIRQRTLLPVVEIPLSVHDLLRSIKLARASSESFAIIGFPAITKNAHFLQDVLQYAFEIRTIHNEAEAQEALEELARAGCPMVLCDMITKSLAQKAGIPAMLITSGAESVEAALDQAVTTSKLILRTAEQADFYKSLLEGRQKPVMVYDAQGEMVYGFGEKALPAAITARLSAAAPGVIQEGPKKLVAEAQGGTYTLSAMPIVSRDQACAAFYVNIRKSAFSLAKSGILYTSKEEAIDQFFDSFYGITQSSSAMGMTVDQFARSEQAVMVLGEIGTGKDQMVRLLYAKGTLSDSPLITVDCAHLSDKGYQYLLENDHSPLMDSGVTLHFSHTRALTEAQFLELFSVLKDLGTHRRNKLLFTYPSREGRPLEERCQELMHLFSCLPLEMPPFRGQVSSVPNLAGLYISMLNMHMARQIIGFEPEALKLLEAYDWPYNYDQFKRVILEVVTLTEGSYISQALVHKVLRRESQQMSSAASQEPPPLDLTGTLEEINLKALQLVLAQVKGNQNAAAKRLGISRTTLWRMLQKIGPASGEKAN